MRRDMEMVRTILVDLSKGKGNQSLNIKKPDDEIYYYHLIIMRQAELIHFRETKTLGGGVIIPELAQLTWQGNDFLDAIENETVWNRTKEIAKEKGFEIASMSFELIKQLAISQGKRILGIE